MPFCKERGLLHILGETNTAQCGVLFHTTAGHHSTGGMFVMYHFPSICTAAALSLGQGQSEHSTLQ